MKKQKPRVPARFHQNRNDSIISDSIVQNQYFSNSGDRRTSINLDSPQAEEEGPMKPEWMKPDAIAYLSTLLQACSNLGMVQDLRSFAPPEALKKASNRLSIRKQAQIREWVRHLNSASEVKP